MSSQENAAKNQADEMNDQHGEGPHIAAIRKKIRKFEKKGWDTTGLQRELEYALGKQDRPSFKTGTAAAVRNENRRPGPMKRFREIDDDVD
jgi:hypothetical protein